MPGPVKIFTFEEDLVNPNCAALILSKLLAYCCPTSPIISLVLWSASCAHSWTLVSWAFACSKAWAFVSLCCSSSWMCVFCMCISFTISKGRVGFVGVGAEGLAGSSKSPDIVI